MSESDWECMESEILEVLDSYGVSAELDIAQNLTMRFVAVLRKKYEEAVDGDEDDE